MPLDSALRWILGSHENLFRSSLAQPTPCDEIACPVAVSAVQKQNIVDFQCGRVYVYDGEVIPVAFVAPMKVPRVRSEFDSSDAPVSQSVRDQIRTRVRPPRLSPAPREFLAP